MATANDVDDLVPGGWLGAAFLIAVTAFALVVIIGAAVRPIDTTRLPPPADTTPTTALIEVVNGEAVPLNCSEVDIALGQCP